MSRRANEGEEDKTAKDVDVDVVDVVVGGSSDVAISSRLGNGNNLSRARCTISKSKLVLLPSRDIDDDDDDEEEEDDDEEEDGAVDDAI